MRIVFFLVLVLGLGLAGTAVYMAQGYIAQTQRELAAARHAAAQVITTTPVYTARRAIRFGERLSEEDVVAIQWPSTALPPGAITDRAELFAPGQPPRAVLRSLEPGEPLMPAKLTRPGQDAGIVAVLTPGMRAFTIDVNVSTGVSGFLRPGDRVDVYWTGRMEGGEVTRLMETSVKVVAVDQSTDQDRENIAQRARNVTVEATPQQVAALALAQATGRLSLALVGLTDDALTELVEVNRRTLFGIEEVEPAPVAAPEPVCSVRTRRGGEVVTIPIPCTN
jgi:pilus assembly protein CpaB